MWRAHPANHPRRTVAIKRLRPDVAVDVRRLQDEADVLAEVDDVHVIRIIEVIDDDGGPAIVMQYAAGGSLADLLATGRRLTPGELVAVAAPVAQALASAHARGLVHGDVKPSNVLLTSDGQPLLADFGVARTVGGRAGRRTLEGTDHYVAPERLAGAAPDGRADIYALGVLCARAVGSADRVPLRLAEVIERATHPDPRARFLRAQDLAWSLRNAVDHDDIRPPAPPGESGGRGRGHDGGIGDTRRFGPRPPRPAPAGERRRRRWPVRLAGALGVAAIAVTVGPSPRPVPSPAVDCPAPSSAQTSVPPGASFVDGDTDGDGCADRGYWYVDPARSPSLVLVVATAHRDRPMSFGIGLAGDVLVLGDWDCDGTDTLALYRPSTGEVYRYDAWPSSGPLEARAELGHAVDAALRVDHEGGCDRLVVDPSA